MSITSIKRTKGAVEMFECDLCGEVDCNCDEKIDNNKAMKNQEEQYCDDLRGKFEEPY